VNSEDTGRPVAAVLLERGTVLRIPASGAARASELGHRPFPFLVWALLESVRVGGPWRGPCPLSVRVSLASWDPGI
jgi:hypothetical protein